MSYTSREEIEAVIPTSVIARACDQDGNGEEDEGVFAALLPIVDSEVDALIVTATNPTGAGASTDQLAAAARAILCETLYRRLGTKPAENPWAAPAAEARAALRKIGGSGSGNAEYEAAEADYSMDQLDRL